MDIIYSQLIGIHCTKQYCAQVLSAQVAHHCLQPSRLQELKTARSADGLLSVKKSRCMSTSIGRTLLHREGNKIDAFHESSKRSRSVQEGKRGQITVRSMNAAIAAVQDLRT